MLIAGCPLGAGTAELGGRRGGGSDPAGTWHLPRVPRRPALLYASALHVCSRAMHFVQRMFLCARYTLPCEINIATVVLFHW